MKFAGQLLDFRRGKILRAQLEQVGPAANKLLSHLKGSRWLDIAEIENRVEPGTAEISGSQANDYSCNRAGIGLISKSSDFIKRSTKPVS